MYMILMRHGEAEAIQTTDAARPLTPQGKLQAADVAAQVVCKYKPDVLVVSPYVRAQQTAQAFAALNLPTMVCADIVPDGHAVDAIRWLSNHVDFSTNTQSVLVVCHMNVIADIDQLLTGQGYAGFNLAEARVYELPFISSHVATLQKIYVSQL